MGGAGGPPTGMARAQLVEMLSRLVRSVWLVPPGESPVLPDCNFQTGIKDGHAPAPSLRLNEARILAGADGSLQLLKATAGLSRLTFPPADAQPSRRAVKLKQTASGAPSVASILSHVQTGS